MSGPARNETLCDVQRSAKECYGKCIKRLTYTLQHTCKSNVIASGRNKNDVPPTPSPHHTTTRGTNLKLIASFSMSASTLRVQ